MLNSCDDVRADTPSATVTLARVTGDRSGEARRCRGSDKARPLCSRITGRWEWPLTTSDDPRGYGIEIEVMDGMHEVEEAAAEFHRFGRWQSAADAGHVHVAANRCQRSDPAQLVQNARIAHVSRVQDVVDACNASTASRRSKPCVSEMTPIVRSVIAGPVTGPSSDACADRGSRAAHRR